MVLALLEIGNLIGARVVFGFRRKNELVGLASPVSVSLPPVAKMMSFPAVPTSMAPPHPDCWNTKFKVSLWPFASVAVTVTISFSLVSPS